ncbi:MAG: nitroreductase family protein [Thermoflexibacter sp.]|nr:nitroreductase family protein [Thermoflexibacter sp.]
MSDKKKYPFVNYTYESVSEIDMLKNTHDLKQQMLKRRSIREFSDRPVPKTLMEDIIRIAASAPSGANRQPWTFCIVSSPQIKKAIREAAEKEEYESYHNRMSEEWLTDLAPLGTDWEKPFLEVAPYLIVVFKRIYELEENGHKHNNYYVNESVGIASGFLIAAIHQAGLVTLTHTPSPMNFLGSILERPANEKPFLLLPVGYPAENVQVPAIQKKPLEEVMVWY